MHTTCLGSAVAISRLASRRQLMPEAARFIELVRCKLVVSGTNLILAMVFAQPLILTWRDSWKLAYLIGLSLGMKLTTEGFYLKDMITYVTNEFTFAMLEEAERKALRIVSLRRLEERHQMFRNALMSATFDYLSSYVGSLAQSAPYENKVLGNEEERVMTIVIVHDEGKAAQLAKVVADIERKAVIVMFSRCGEFGSA
ncbi:MAG: hypothetical protein SGPRY_009196 [Prymnesium sp.]